jgi:hypothetical protein
MGDRVQIEPHADYEYAGMLGTIYRIDVGESYPYSVLIDNLLDHPEPARWYKHSEIYKLTADDWLGRFTAKQLDDLTKIAMQDVWLRSWNTQYIEWVSKEEVANQFWALVYGCLQLTTGKGGIDYV